MFTDLIVKFLMWMEKHEDFVMKAVIFGLSVVVTIMFIAAILAIPEFIKDIIGR